MLLSWDQASKSWDIEIDIPCGALRPCLQCIGSLGPMVGGHRPYFLTQIVQFRLTLWCIPNVVPETYVSFFIAYF